MVVPFQKTPGKGKTGRYGNLFNRLTPSMEPKLSIVLTCYQGKDWIGETIESVLNQTYRDWELIIVNDASPDESAVVLERHRSQDPRIGVVTNPKNMGIAASCNRGLKEVKGTYFSLLDQDDLWKPEKAARQVQYLEQHKNVDVVWCRLELIDAQGHTLGERKLPEPRTGNLFLTFFKHGAAPMLSCMYRSSLLERVGLFNETLEGNEDLDFMLRVADVTSFGFVPEILVEQRYRPGSFSDRDIMVFDQFRVADLLEETWPQHSGLVRRFRSRAHYGTAHYLVRNNRLEEARQHFLRSALLRPIRFKAWCWWIVALLPETIRKHLPHKLRLSADKYAPRPNVVEK